MLKIRLSRAGKKGQPSFRIIVQEHTSAVKGKFIEEIGYYRPTTKDKEFIVKLERVSYWIGKGAKPSDSMAVLLKKHGVEGMEKYIAPRDKKRKSKKEGGEATPPIPADKQANAETPTSAPARAETHAPAAKETPAAAHPQAEQKTEATTPPSPAPTP